MERNMKRWSLISKIVIVFNLQWANFHVSRQIDFFVQVNQVSGTRVSS